MQFGPGYGGIAKIAEQLSNGLVNSAMGQIPCSTERISSYIIISRERTKVPQHYNVFYTAVINSWNKHIMSLIIDH